MRRNRSKRCHHSLTKRVDNTDDERALVQGQLLQKLAGIKNSVMNSEAYGSAVSPKRAPLHRYSSGKFKNMEGLLTVDWVLAMLDKDDTSSVITAGAMVAEDSKLPADHMVRF